MQKKQICSLVGWVTLLLFCLHPLQAANKSTQEIGGLSVSVPFPESEVLQAVEAVTADGTIQGSKEYNKDEYVAGAEAVRDTPAYPHWSGAGQVFYKVKLNALDPRNFKEGGDSGTLAVRYVVQPGDDKNTILKIDAVFVDDFHHRAHASNGSVEGAEYAAIQDHLAAMHLQQQHAAQEEQRRQQELAAKNLERDQRQAQLELSLAAAPGESLEQHVRDLRRRAGRLVKPPGKLRSAPYRSASSLKILPAGTEVIILVSTRYWYGVETEDGMHGWLHRSELELLP